MANATIADVKLGEIEDRLAALESGGGDGSGTATEKVKATARGSGEAPEVLHKVAARLEDFEVQITAQLTEMQVGLDKRFTNMTKSNMMAGDTEAAGNAVASPDIIASTLHSLRHDVEDLREQSSHNKGEMNSLRRIVLACERDMEDFTCAMDAVNVDLDEIRARVDATCSIIATRQRVEATMSAEISAMGLDVVEFQEALRNHDTWMEDASNTLQQMHEKSMEFQEALKDHDSWIEDASIAMKNISSKDENLAQDIIKKITGDTDQAVNALNGRIDITNKAVEHNKDQITCLQHTQVSEGTLNDTVHNALNSLNSFTNTDSSEIRTDLERSIAELEKRLQADMRLKQQEMLKAHSNLLEYTIKCMAAEADMDLEDPMAQCLHCSCFSGLAKDRKSS